MPFSPLTLQTQAGDVVYVREGGDRVVIEIRSQEGWKKSIYLHPSEAVAFGSRVLDCGEWVRMWRPPPT